MHVAWNISALALVMSLAACGRAPAPDMDDESAAAAGPAAAQRMPAAGGDSQPAADGDLPSVLVYKGPACGCCESWVGHMRAAGFTVEVRNTEDLGTIMARAGVPAELGSCHTAEVGGYFVEGHVPADDVKRLLAEKPDARGLAVPGMPQGSPGMEQGGVRQAYDVLLVAKNGSTSVFAHHGD